jgi:hypothetical protein
MTDDIALTKDIEHGQHAERLLADELLTDAFAALEADYIAAWKATSARDSDARERLWQALQIVGLVKSHLAAIVSSGRLAQRELDDIAALGERRRIFGVL